ncbi:MAG: acyl-CoA dehydrogenase family protein [Syntrophobacteraceae bacterium]
MFIEKLYAGEFDADLFRASGPTRDETKVGRIIARYRETLLDHGPGPIEDEGGIPRELLAEMGRAGYFGLSIEERYGGVGLNLWEYLKVVEEMVKLDISIAIAFLAHLSIGVKAIQLFGTEEQRQKYLPPAASGQMIFSYALTEPRIGSDAQHIETVALADEGGRHYILNGRKAYITNANYAGGLTAFAQLDPKRPGFMGAFIVETGWEGVKVGKEMPKMGLKASSTAAIQFKNVRVPSENLIGRPGDGFRIAMSVLNYGRLGLGAASTAVLEVSARDMLERASRRVQFQVPIKTFQLVQEKIVRARVNAAVSSAMNDFAAALLHKDPLGNVAIETSHCKLFGTTRAWDAVYEALQVAGGSGYLKTQPYEKRMRDFRVVTVFEGTTEIHSIYPALFGMRRLAGIMKERGLSGRSRVAWLLGLLSGRRKSPVRFDNPVMRKALAEAESCAGAARRLIVPAMLLHGKKIAQGKIADREFLLRRITTLSLYMFGILALLSRMAGKENGRRLGAGELDILAYFTQEAREARRENSRFRDSKKERVGSAVFAGFEKEGESDRP